MTDPHRTFLGVERSAGGRRWVHALDGRAEGVASQIAREHDIPDLVARVLAGRGVEASNALPFLVPRIRDLMPDPSTLTDMDVAAARLADAVDRGEGNPDATEPDDFAGTGGTGGVVRNQDQDAQ